MKLTKRLQAIADLVPNDSKIIDVGCDHALLDIYLTVNKNVKCIAVDINENSIIKSRENIEKFNLEDKIKLIKSDGLKKVTVSREDIIIIAGMGTKNIIKILRDLKHNNELILLSNKDIPILRQEVVKLGYYIVDEMIITDFKIDYVIIKFKKGYKKYKKIDYELGPIIKNEKKYDFYKHKLLDKYKKRYLKIPSRNLYRKLCMKIKIHRINRFLKQKNIM